MQQPSRFTQALTFLLALATIPFAAGEQTTTTPRWNVAELSFESSKSYGNPYTEVEFWAVFINENGTELKRPGFWDGDQTWKIRFAPPAEGNSWSFETFSSDSKDSGLHGQKGTVKVEDYTSDNALLQHGLLRMSADKRNVIHADGTVFLMVGDTPWGLPFRGTKETVLAYSQDRQSKGFNTALLMSVQPDQRSQGPRDRTSVGSFGVGFEDLSKGHLNELNPGYFQYLDTLIDTLIQHEIVPVYSPVFQGFGWKGEGALGSKADPVEYTRYVRYLIARYGAYPAMWLASADASGRDKIVQQAGETFEEWDDYQQPTGIHYNPFDDQKASWTDDLKQAFHYNRVDQDKVWLDFQWAQTGHSAAHKPEKVAAMWENKPAKAGANGEPTYENISGMGHASGWWQGHEAWQNLVHGGTMGVVYGAGGLWNWKLFADEPGWPDWANTPASWKDAIAFEGSRYVGYLSKALEGQDILGMAPMPELAEGHPLLAIPGKFYLSYLPDGGSIAISKVPASLKYRWFNPKEGTFSKARKVAKNGRFTAPSKEPWVLLVSSKN